MHQGTIVTWLSAVAVVAVAGLSVTPASGQATRADERPLGRPLGQPLGLGERSATDPSIDRQAVDSYRAASPFWEEPYVGPAPHAEVRQVPYARAMFTAAKWTFMTAQTNFANLYRAANWEFEHSPEYLQAQRAVDEAAESYRQARNEALAPLSRNQRYATLVELVESLESQIVEERAADEPDAARLRALAEARLEVAQQMTQYEVALLRTPAVNAALQRLQDAGERLDDLKLQHERALRNDPQIAQARRQMQQLRIAKNTASAYLDSVVNARDIALRFAAYETELNRYIPRLATPFYDDPYAYSGAYAYDPQIDTIGNRPFVGDVDPVVGR